MIHSKELFHAAKMMEKGYNIYKPDLVKLVKKEYSDHRYMMNCLYLDREFGLDPEKEVLDYFMNTMYN